MHCAPGCTCCASAQQEAAFLVTINPEARVEAHRSDLHIVPLRCGEWLTVPVGIVNQAFVTGPLHVRWPQTPGIEVMAPDTELTGATQQQTLIQVRLTQHGDVDLTLRFWALGALGGLANKNSASLYLRAALPVAATAAIGDV